MTAQMPLYCYVMSFALKVGLVVDNMQVFHLIKCRALETGQLKQFTSMYLGVYLYCVL